MLHCAELAAQERHLHFFLTAVARPHIRLHISFHPLVHTFERMVDFGKHV